MTNYKKALPKKISFALDVYGYPTIINETAGHFSNRIISSYLSHKFSSKRIQETEIVIISDLEDMTYHHYLEQPKSMLCRKLFGRFHESTQDEIYDFKYKWLSDSFKHKQIFSQH